MQRFPTKPALFLLFLFSTVWAQPPAGRLLILTEGNPPFGALEAVDYPARTNSVLANLPQPGFGSFNDLLFYANRLFAVDGNGDVVVFDAYSLDSLGKLTGLSARGLAAHDSLLLVACSAAPYFKVYDAFSLSASLPLWSLDVTRVRSIAEAVWVDAQRDLAYVTVNDYGADSLVVVVDLLTEDTLKTLSVFPNPNALAPMGDSLLVQSLDYTGIGLVVGTIDLATQQVVGRDTLGYESYGSFAVLGQQLYFGAVQAFTPYAINRWTPATGQVEDSLIVGNFYAATAAAGGLFLSSTDYFSFGNVTFWNGTTLDAPVATTNHSPRRLLWAPLPSLAVSPANLPDSLCNASALVTLSATSTSDSIRWTLVGVDSATGPGPFDVDLGAGLSSFPAVQIVEAKTWFAGQYVLWRDTVTIVNAGGPCLLGRSETGDQPDWARCWPNPTHGVVHLEWDSPNAPQLQVLDALGSVHWQGTAPNRLDLSPWPQGLYVLRMASPAGSQSLRLLVQH